MIDADGSVPQTLLETPLTRITRARGSEAAFELRHVARAGHADVAEPLLRHDYRISSSLSSSLVLTPREWLDKGGPGFRLEDDGSLPLSQRPIGAIVSCGDVLDLAVRAAHALDELHQQDLVHGLISTDTIWVNRVSGAVRLCCLMTAGKPSTGPRPARERELGQSVFLAPEQNGWLNRPVDQRSDLYSLGIVIYHLLTGRYPFDATDASRLLHRQLAGEVTPLQELDPGIPENLSRVVAKLLRTEPADRYQTAAGLADDLGVCIEEWKTGETAPGFLPGSTDVTLEIRRPTKVVGRESEIDQAMKAVDRSRWGSKEVVFLRGPSGIGKSAVIREVEYLVRGGDAYFLSGKYDQYSQNRPYSALIEAVQSLVQQIQAEGPEEVEAWRKQIIGKVGGNLRVITEIVPEVAEIAGSGDPIVDLAPEERRNRLNQTFGNFVHAFTERGRTLVVALDDLQWADPPSLYLLSSILRQPGTSHLAVMGSFRDSEVGPAHPLNVLIAELRQAGISIVGCRPGPLSEVQVKELVGEALGAKTREVAWLAETIRDATEGNPFHIHQLLATLTWEDVLSFDPGTKTWKWDPDVVERHIVDASILDLITRRISALSPATQEMLRAAACLGTGFSFETLGIATRLGEAPLAAAIREATEAGLLIDRPAPHPTEEKRRYLFAHDGVQNAAMTLIPAMDLAAYRFDIGRRLMNDDGVDRYVVLANINLGTEEDLAASERLGIARLNLDAGRVARNRLAYEEAVELFRHGLRWLPGKAEREQHDLAFNLLLESFESVYLTKRFEEAERLFDRALAMARDRTNMAEVFHTRVILDTSLGRYEEAILNARTALRLYGVALPSTPRTTHLIGQLARTRLYIRFRSARDLEKMSDMSDPDELMKLRLLMGIGPPAYFTNPTYLFLSALHVVNISLRKGNAPGSGYGYVIYAMALGAQLGRYAEGQEFGELAVRLARRHDDPALYCKILLILGGFVNFWSRSFEQSISLLEEALQASLSVGDMQYAGYSILQTIFLQSASGLPLGNLAELMESYEPFIVHSGATFPLDTLRLRQKAVEILQSPGSTLPDELDPLGTVQLLDADNSTTTAYRAVLSLQIAYYFGDYDRASHLAEISGSGIENAVSQIMYAEHHFFAGLLAARRLAGGHSAAHRDRKELGEALKKFRVWADSAPSNFSAMYMLLRAEQEATAGRVAKAIRSYDAAIAAAQKAGMIQIEALANRQAADFHHGQGGIAIARAYQSEAERLLKAWGALALIEPPAEAPSRQDAGVTDSADLIAAKRATQAVFGEMNPSTLIPRTLDVVIECARAQRGFFVLKTDGGGLRIEASGAVSRASAAVPDKGWFELGDAVCKAVVEQAIRNREDFRLDDASADEHFGRNPYFSAGGKKSVACVPVLQGQRVLGAFYLENDLASGVFTDERLDLIHLIASETAFALEHARLYLQQTEANQALRASLRKVELLEKAKTHLNKFVPNSVRRIIEENPEAPTFEKRDRDISILFLDVVGYTRLGESLERREVDYLMEEYFSSYLDDIYANEGDINETSGDGLMILFQNPDQTTNAIQAVRTAIAVQQLTEQANRRKADLRKPVTLKASINSGIAAVGSAKFQSAGAIRYTYTASGSVINIAARIAAITPGGAILVSAETGDRVAGTFATEDFGEHLFKNVSKPVGVRRIRLNGSEGGE